LIVVAQGVDPRWRLVVLANRDEWHARPAEPAGWRDGGLWLGGLDVQAGGTWLAVRRDGAFAAVTNVREPTAGPGERSRGELPGRVLGAPSLEEGVSAVWEDAGRYAGFHVVAGDAGGAWHACSRGVAPRRRDAGVWAVSNAVGGAVWPKMAGAADALAEALALGAGDDALMALMWDATPTPDALLPRTGVPLEWERALSGRFVRLPGYGTRATTLVRVGWGEVSVVERRFNEAGASSEAAHRWTLGAAPRA
jgi:uncharacterized protein with NRDE domain